MKLQSKVMLRYSLYTIKNKRVRTILYTINKNGLQTNMRKIDGIAVCGGAHTQHGSRKLILNPTGSEPHPQV